MTLRHAPASRSDRRSPTDKTALSIPVIPDFATFLRASGQTATMGGRSDRRDDLPCTEWNKEYDHDPSACCGSSAACQLVVVRRAGLCRQCIARLVSRPARTEGDRVSAGNGAEQVRQSVQQAQPSEVTLYVQAADDAVATAAREAAEALGLLGTRIFVTQDELTSIHLADNLADAIVAAADADVADAELLRVLRPQATALVGERRLTKPLPTGTDDWSHVYHGPDNNPQSQDTTVRGELTTQFIAGPTFSPMPEQTVVAGGRIFKAMGHIAHKANQNEMLNSLLGINGYNGTILWHRPLPEGFMLHRNTMIATDDALYMADHESCKVIDAVSGEIRARSSFPPASAMVLSGNGWACRAAYCTRWSVTRRSTSTRSDPTSAVWATGPGTCGRATTTATRAPPSVSDGRFWRWNRPPAACSGTIETKTIWTRAVSA